MQEANTLGTVRKRATGRHSGLIAAVLLLLGLALRYYFLRFHAFMAGDSILYQDIAQNWLHAHVYGLSTDAAPRPTLIRLPGYPAILAACAWAFDRYLQADLATLHSFLPVLWLQIVADLGTCGLVAFIARDALGRRAGLAALALACLCPFTANYIAVPLTETFTLFFLALAFRSLQLWLRLRATRWIALLGVSLACGVLLRPDQGILIAAVLPAIFFAGDHGRSWKVRATPLALCLLIAALPSVPWAARNYRTFHVIQPLAPKLANDPGEIPPVGFQRWFRTWGIDFAATQDAYWKYPEEPVLMDDLPARAFDSPDQRARTAVLLDRAASTLKLDPVVDAAFAALARERIAAHPFRYYLGLPAARLANMLLHPRTEMLPVSERWWEFRAHPSQTIFAVVFGALNLAYFAAAFAGWRAMRSASKVLALSMLGYILLRCALLLTIDNPEQRYTLEFFPLLFVFASGLFTLPADRR
jgi:4-amino-4-deoxy-L-arabinose transferase-like glycosyltransferase